MNKAGTILEEKVDRMLQQFGEKCPGSANAAGIYDNTSVDIWTSGFWPGILWIMHDLTKKEHYRQAAWKWDRDMELKMLEENEFLHDVGFQFLSTAVIKYKLTGDEDAKRRGLSAANFLAGRFNLAGNYIRAWKWRGDEGWAIIDCLMNLPLLFWASEESGDPRFKHIALAHAETVLNYFIRPDGSVNHIVSFNPDSGDYIESLGGQGYGPDSSWSRGQSWALYGLAVLYRITGDKRFLDASKKVAHYFISALPDDYVPYWDFRVPSLADEPRDTSAGAIAASGLLELEELLPEFEGRLYRNWANKILTSLTEKYTRYDDPAYEGILASGTGHKPEGRHINVPLIYGDYFYVEALAKLNGWKMKVY
ncbi:glycoside hydrolase family 88 protein [Metabacillus indicus]|uniref:glycoside hydrolase family 88 protein n=1 Tax=Metabacillus indicus TaxID=246786 RepID=UPI00398450C0